MNSKIKQCVVVLSVLLMSASCNPFSTPTVGGVVKTVNGGADWQFFNTLKDVKNGSIAALNVSKMAFDPANRQTVYVSGYNGGLYKSEDAATSWTRILTNMLVYDFAPNPTNPKVIYAAGVYGDNGRVLATIDGGASWQQIFNEGSIGNPVRSIALNPTNPSQLIIGTESGSVIKSSDGGLSWRLIRNYNDRVSEISWKNGNVYVLLKSQGLLKSMDNGENFVSLTDTLTHTASTTSFFQASTKVQAFYQFFVDSVSPSLMYVTTDLGLYKSVDEGKAWTLITTLPVKQAGLVARAIAIANNSSNIVFASVAGTIYKSTDAGTSWQTQRIPTAGFINYILIDPQLPQIVYAGVYGQ